LQSCLDHFSVHQSDNAIRVVHRHQLQHPIGDREWHPAGLKKRRQCLTQPHCASCKSTRRTLSRAWAQSSTSKANILQRVYGRPIVCGQACRLHAGVPPSVEWCLSCLFPRFAYKERRLNLDPLLHIRSVGRKIILGSQLIAPSAVSSFNAD
jgi:hypothetical protein